MKSRIERDKKKRNLVLKFEKKRLFLKSIANDMLVPKKQRFEATLELASLPRSSSKVRVKNRCLLTGRSKSVYRELKISRIMLRELCSSGMIPGLKKSSW